MTVTETDPGTHREDAPGDRVEGAPGASGLTLEELTRLALAADPDAALPDDAVPLGPSVGDGPLPSWYMPAASGHLTGRRGVAVAVLIVAALLLIVASGLCITYGQLTVA